MPQKRCRGHIPQPHPAILEVEDQPKKKLPLKLLQAVQYLVTGTHGKDRIGGTPCQTSNGRRVSAQCRRALARFHVPDFNLQGY
jgi:hypothetical protein